MANTSSPSPPSRWPAENGGINAELTQITTVSVLSTFMSSLDQYSGQLMKILRKKGGETARRITAALSAISQSSRIEVKCECILKAVIIYLNENPQNLIKEYMGVSLALCGHTPHMVGAESDDSLEDVGIIIERCTVLQDLHDVASGCALLFGLIYCLNLSYPKPLCYTFEFFQKVLMGLEDKKLSNKIQVLKKKLCQKETQ
ncbi:Fc receptor-like protein [Sarotherodon galilaeus]